MGLSLGIYGGLRDWECPDNISLSKVSAKTGIDFPRSTKLIHANWSTCKCDLDFIKAVITMDGGDVDGFVRKAFATARAARENGHMFNNMDREEREYYSKSEKVSRTSRLGIDYRHLPRFGRPSWWRPDSVSKFLAVRIRAYPRQDEPEQLHMIIDEGDPRHAVLYLDYGVAHP